MAARTLILIAALVFIVAFAFLTIYTAAKDGPDVLTLFSLLVLAMLGFGIVGALRQPPSE